MRFAALTKRPLSSASREGPRFAREWRSLEL
jgi:hypothetical protein